MASLPRRHPYEMTWSGATAKARRFAASQRLRHDASEPNWEQGSLNRYLPRALGEVRLTRRFETLSAGEVELAFGFSDEVSLAVDDAVVFAGTNTFQGFDSYEDRSYVDINAHSMRLPLEPGVRTLAATLKVTEYFGWGLIVALRGTQARLLPAEAGDMQPSEVSQTSEG